jgi:hypothetical protein
MPSSLASAACEVKQFSKVVRVVSGYILVRLMRIHGVFLRPVPDSEGSLRIETGFCKVQLSCFEISHCPVTVHFSLEGVRVRRFERKDVISYRYRLPFAQPTRVQAS